MRPTRAPFREIFSWTMFDFANTGFYVIIITLVYNRYFVNTVAGGNEAVWSRTIAASMLLTALVGPLLGSVADATNRKKGMLGVFTISCIAATALLWFTGAGTLPLAVLLVIVANMGFEGGTIFYDAFLPELVPRKEYGKLSGYGFAMGYIGSFVILLTVLPLLNADPLPPENVKLTFLIAAAYFAIFSLPLFIWVREKRSGERVAGGRPLSEGYRRLRATIKNIRSYRDVTRFLLAYFVYNDSILTVIFFASIYADQTLGMSEAELITFFLIVQATALIGSVVFGFLTNKIGARSAIAITLVLWIGVVVAAFFVTTAQQFYIVGAVAGIGLGSSQSCSRTMMALLTPIEKRAEFFGFYDGFFGKASAVIGPLIYGEVSQAIGEREAMLVVAALFMIGLGLLMRVPDVRSDV